VILFSYVLILWFALTSGTLALWHSPSTGNVILGAFGVALPFAIIPAVWAYRTPKEDRSSVLDYGTPTKIALVVWGLITLGHCATT
jgi:hypothetical protein